MARRDDYILRLIAELAQGLHQVLGLRKLAEYQAALRLIDDFSNQLIGLDTARLATLRESELLARLTFAEPGAFGTSKCSIFAALLREAGGIYAAQQRDDESHACFLAALQLMLYTHRQPVADPLPDYAPPVEALADALGTYSIPFATQADLLNNYELRGAYARGEDLLFVMLDEPAQRPAALQLGLAFYQRLRQQSDAALEAGGLPRAEVEEGLTLISFELKVTSDE